MFAYRNIQASQASAKEMEDMTAVTYRIALKTEKETVAMKIVTLVTLLFLPATFVSVSFPPRKRCFISDLSNQTLMSTDIVKFTTDDTPDKPHKVFSLGALQLFFAVCVPLMIVTCAGWWLWSRYVNARSRHTHQMWAQRHLNIA